MEIAKRKSLLLLLMSLFVHNFTVTVEASGRNLPTDIQPVFYALILRPFPDDDIYSGYVQINFLCRNSTDKIVLHADYSLFIPPQNLTVRIISKESTSVLPIAHTSRNIRTNQFTITMKNKFQAQNIYRLDIYFSGKFTTKENWGFVRERYTDKDTGEERWYVVTKMIPGTARKIFPCFENMQYKAPFDITVARRNVSGITTLSNMKLRSAFDIIDTTNAFNSKSEPGWIWEDFHTTPPILPSSVGVVISDLQKMESKFAPMEISIYGRPELWQSLKTVLEEATEQFLFLKKFLDLNLPVIKIDIVALPNFVLDEETNSWGLITMSDKYVPDDWTALHGMLDQWFVHLVSPTDNIDDSLFHKAIHSYFSFQSGLMTWTPSGHLDGLFDDNISPKIYTNTYEWLFRMLNYSLTANTLRSGFRSFIRDRIFSTYTDTDLWYWMTISAHQDGTLQTMYTVQEIVDSWTMADYLPESHTNNHDDDDDDSKFSWTKTDQAFVIVGSDHGDGNGTADSLTGRGYEDEEDLQTRLGQYPIVTVTRHYEENTASLVQDMFLRRRQQLVTDLWWIPIMYLSPENLDTNSIHTTVWMKEEKQINITNLPGTNDFIIINPEFAGMFVVNYDERNWNLLAEYLRGSNLTSDLALTRSKLLFDSWNIAYVGNLSMVTALNMTLFLANETNHDVWEPFDILISEFLDYISDTAVESKLEKYILQQLLQAKSKGADWISQRMLCRLGHESCVAYSRQAFHNWIHNKNFHYPPTYEQFCDTFKWGSMDEFELGLQELKKYTSTHKDVYATRLYLLQALAVCPTQRNKINRYMTVLFIENNNFFHRDIMTIFTRFKYYSRPRWTAILDFVSNHFASVKERIGQETDIWNLVINEVTRHFITKKGLNKVRNFHLTYEGQFGSAENIIQMAEKTVAVEVEWSNKNLAAMEDWLDSNLVDVTKFRSE